MREDTPHTSTSSNCNCPTVGCGHTDIEEFGKTFENIGKGMYNTTNLRRSNPRLPELNTRLRKSTHGMDAATTNIVDTVALCTCQQSRSYPFCDNTHQTFNKETNSSLSPIIVAIVEDNNRKCSDCGAKLKGDNVKNSHTDSVRDNLRILEEKTITRKTSGDLYSNRAPPPSEIPLQSPHCTDLTSTPIDHVNKPPPLPKIKPSSIKDKINQQNVFTSEEVAQHNTKDSLWMIIKGNVYDITTYVRSHPGGERALLKFAGKDGTENVQFHSSTMLEILNSSYFIGKLYTEEAPSRCTVS